MMEKDLTEGARRVLEVAARLAAESRKPATEPLHLLWALALDESRASEILERHGVRLELLQAECPLFVPDSPEDELLNTHSVDDFANYPLSNSSREVLQSARSFVVQAGRQYEIGTESLLFGLLHVPGPVSELLIRFGLATDRLADQASEVAGIHSQPIDVDFRIAWKSRTPDEQVATLRILDASANRAREGMRVVEDWLRFSRNNAHLAELAKRYRHELGSVISLVVPAELLSARDTPGDVGTSISTIAEMTRESPEHVAMANLKRAQEAVRSIEEFGKIVSADLAKGAEQLRYRLYTLEKAIAGTRGRRPMLEERRLYLLVTEELCHHGSGPAVREAIAHGVGIVQVREKRMADRELLAHAKRVCDWCREAGALCIINDRPDIAVLADADGVHVGQDELSVSEVRRIVGVERLVGVSTHNLEQARQAVLDGADYLGVGPVFRSGTKSFEQLAGLEFVRSVAAEISLPWYAIGGITAANLATVQAAGASRIAVSGAICGSGTPGAAAHELSKMLENPVSES